MIAMAAAYRFTGFLDTNPLASKRADKEEEQKEILFGLPCSLTISFIYTFAIPSDMLPNSDQTR